GGAGDRLRVKIEGVHASAQAAGGEAGQSTAGAYIEERSALQVGGFKHRGEAPLRRSDAIWGELLEKTAPILSEGKAFSAGDFRRMRAHALMIPSGLSGTGGGLDNDRAEDFGGLAAVFRREWEPGV